MYPEPACVLQGTKPEVRTYNTIISACNRSGQPENALRVYERMLADGAQPTATTYTALISAYGKTGKVRGTQPQYLQGTPWLPVTCHRNLSQSCLKHATWCNTVMKWSCKVCTK